MLTADFFRARLGKMIDRRNPLAPLEARLRWTLIKTAVAPTLFQAARRPKRVAGDVPTRAFDDDFGGSLSPAGRPWVRTRLMVSLLYLKSSFNLSDNELVEHLADSVVIRFFSSTGICRPIVPCDFTQMARFRRFLDGHSIEQLLKVNIDCTLGVKAVQPAELKRLKVENTVQFKIIAHLVDKQPPGTARYKLVGAAKRVRSALRQAYAQEGSTLRSKASSFARAKKFSRLRDSPNRLSTILGVVMRTMRRKLEADQAAVIVCGAPAHGTNSPKCVEPFAYPHGTGRADRTQQRVTKHKPHTVHSPEVKCISKNNARKPYEFGVKGSMVVMHDSGLMIGARSRRDNNIDAPGSSAPLDQTTNLPQDTSRMPEQVTVDLNYQGVDADNPGVLIIDRGKVKLLTDHEGHCLSHVRPSNRRSGTPWKITGWTEIG